jgi:hypothetical protein
MKSNEKTLVYLSTIFIDISLIWILLNEKLNNYDTIFICTAIFVHIWFYIGLFFNNRTLLDICHVMLTIAIICSIFIKNKMLLSLLLLLLILIHIIWICFNECILNTKEQNKRNITLEITGIHASTIFQIITIILVLKIAI